jgi:tape measure domain-containing protein
VPGLPGAAEPAADLEGWQVWDLVLRLGGQLRAIPGAVLGWDMTAALAMARRSGSSPSSRRVPARDRGGDGAQAQRTQIGTAGMAEKKVSVRLAPWAAGRSAPSSRASAIPARPASGSSPARSMSPAWCCAASPASLAGAFSIRQVVDYADTWTDLRSRVDLATGSQEKGAAVMERLADMARRTYSSLGQTTESWLANATALRELGLSTRATLDFTEALNNAMVVSGARAERAASVQNALSKAMALGTLSGDNLNTVIASGGRVAELLAAELGTNVNQLRGLGSQGAITGEVIRSRWSAISRCCARRPSRCPPPSATPSR